MCTDGAGRQQPCATVVFLTKLGPFSVIHTSAAFVNFKTQMCTQFQLLFKESPGECRSIEFNIRHLAIQNPTHSTYFEAGLRNHVVTHVNYANQLTKRVLLGQFLQHGDDIAKGPSDFQGPAKMCSFLLEREKDEFLGQRRSFHW